MRWFITAAALYLSFPVLTSPVLAQAPNHLWSQSLGGSGSVYAERMAVDADGNVYVTGRFSGTMNLGGAPLTSAGSTDVFLAKYSPSGTNLWSQRFGGPSGDTGWDVAIQSNGTVVLLGEFQGTAVFGADTLISAGNSDLFIARVTPLGGYIQSQSYGGTFLDRPYGLAIDSSDNIIVTGEFSGTVSFGGASLVSAGQTDIFVAKYGPTGAHQWSQRFGNGFADHAYSVDTDSFDNIVVTGAFWLTVNFGGGDLVSAGSLDAFLAKYNSAGTHQWSRRFGSTTADYGYCVTVDDADNVIASGIFQASGDFDPDVLVSAGGFDLYLVEYDAAGTHQFSKRIGGTGNEYVSGVTTNASQDILLTGDFDGTADLGGGPFPSYGGRDVYLAQYDNTGAYSWSRQFGGTFNDLAGGLALSGSDILITGYYQGVANFGGADFWGLVGTYNSYLARYTDQPIEPVITAIADIGNDQGRRVKITFDRSAHDGVSSQTPVDHYEAYRRNDAPPSNLVVNPASLSTGQLLDSGWTEVGTVHAHATDEYSMDAPTVGDSTIALGAYNSTFFIRAATASPVTFFDSAPDSGYSLDNMAPGIPQNLVYTTGDLSWNESSAADFDYFTVYGANVDDFGSATLVNYTVAPGMDVSGSPYSYYFVTATDFSGNEGRPGEVFTSSGVGDTPRNYVLSVSNYPNPFNPRTTVSYTVPSRGDVSVVIYDTHGAKVATLVSNETRDAGAYRVDWNGRADSGATVSSGVYFARIEHPGGARSKKMVLLK